MKSSIVILLLLTFFSCSNEKNKKLTIFNNLAFNLLEGERANSPNAKTKKLYSDYFNNSEIQIPLFKCITHKDYEIFIGIPFSTTIDAMIKSQENKPHNVGYQFKSDSLSYCLNYEKDSYYIAEYAVKISDKALIYIAGVSRTKMIADSLFNLTALSQRIITNQ